MARMKRKQLKKPKKVSDEQLLRQAKAAATRHQNKMTKRARAEAADRSARRDQPD